MQKYIAYIERELSEKTTDKKIKIAYDCNAFSVVVQDNKTFYIIGSSLPDWLHARIKAEVKKFYPHLIYLYDLRRPQL